MRTALSLTLVLLLTCCSAAQEPSVLTQMWEQSPIPLGETAVVVDAYVGDLDNNGVEEACVVTSGVATGRTATQKNRVVAYGANGTVFWTYGVDGRVRASALYDINNDRNLEFIVSSGEKMNLLQSGSIRVIGGFGNLLRSFSSSAIVDSMYVTDMDGDRYYEIVGGGVKRVFLYRSFGENIWHYPPEGGGGFNVSVNAVHSADINGDGVSEVAAGADRIYYIDLEGNLMGSVDTEPEVHQLKKGFKYLEMVRLGGGGYLDTLAVTESDRIVAVGVEDGMMQQDVFKIKLNIRWTTDLGCTVNAVETYNIDTDDFTEVIVACSDNKVYAIDNNGWTVWEYPLDGEPMDLYIKDMDGDGLEDLLVGTSSGSIYLLDLSGDFKWIHKTGSPVVKVAAGDIDGDRMNEVFVVSEEPLAKAYAVNETYTLRRRADTTFNMGQEAYITSDYDDALKYFREASDLYRRLGSEKGVMDSQTFIAKIESRILEERRAEADIFYERAQDAFIAGDYAGTRQHVGRAKGIYEEFGDIDGVVKCELLEVRIDQQTGVVEPTVTLPRSTSTTVPDTGGGGDNTLLIILAGGVGLLAAVFIMKRRSAGAETIDESVDSSKDAWEREVLGLDDETEEDVK